MSRVHIERHYGAYIIGQRRDVETGERGELVQTDWDYPATAQRLGWSLTRVQRVPVTDADALESFQVVTLKRRPSRQQIARNHYCEHSSTDGTVTCDCGITASEFIAAAGEYLDSLC